MKENFIEDDDFIKIDVMKYITPVLKNWKKILLVGLCSAVIGVAFSFTFPKEYKVVTRLAPELSLRSNSLTSLASIAGINMNMLGNNNDALLPTVYPDIVSSVPFITGLFDMPVGEKTLYEYMLNDQKLSLVGKIMSFPGVVVSSIIGIFKSSDEEGDSIDASINNFQLTKEQYNVFKAISKRISVSVDKKTFIVTITVIAQDRVVAADLAKNVNENLRKYVVAYRTDKTRQVVNYLNEALIQARGEYYDAQRKFAIYSDRHQNVLLQSDLIEKQRLQNDVNLKFQLFSSLSQQLQQQEVQLQQETPVFAEVIPATVPLRKYKPMRMRFLIVFFVLGCAIASVCVLHKK